MYHITEYTYRKAASIGVTVKPSTRQGKKLDVYKSGKKIASVGAIGYKSYPEFIKEKGLEFANLRRNAYKARHEKDRHIKWSNGWLSDQLLW
jgi:hypothetical protein